MTDTEAGPSADSYESHALDYCESCGRIQDGSDDLVEALDEPVHRVDVLEELGGVTDDEVHETVAMEKGDCPECEAGTLVNRYYAVGEVPKHDYDPDPSEMMGRDPDEDALIGSDETGWKEVDEVAGLEVDDGE